MLSKPLNKKIILPKSKDILSQMGSVVSLIASIYFFLWVNINKQLVTFKSSLHKNRNVLYLLMQFSHHPGGLGIKVEVIWKQLPILKKLCFQHQIRRCLL